MRSLGVALIVWSFVAATPVGAQAPADPGLEESVDVRLILIETLALNQSGGTIPKLDPDSIQLTIGETLTSIHSIDANCPGGPMADPVALTGGSTRAPAPDVPRKIVFLFDYLHLTMRDRDRVVEQAQEMVRQGMTPKEEIMVSALSDRLRVEQRFTADTDEVVESLKRMQYDSSLFGRDHRATPGEAYLEALSTLMDVLSQYDGPKVVLLFSAAESRGDVYREWFDDVAQRAASGRTAIYPARAQWMERIDPSYGLYRLEKKEGAQGVRILSKLAQDTGGRVPPARTQDLSLSYARAQRDLSCRHVVGYETDAASAGKAHEIRMLTPRGTTLIHPRQIRVWPEDDVKRSRLRAAFADPSRFEHPLVRTTVVPFRPTGRKEWDTFIAIHLPMPVDADGVELDVKATLTREGLAVEDYHRSFQIPGTASGTGRQPVTLFADAKLQSGDHILTIVLTSPDIEGIVTTASRFEVPVADRKATVVLGPMISRVVEGGVAIRADDDTAADTAVDRILEDGETFEPLVVHSVSPSERFVMAWSVCSGDKSLSGTIERKIIAEDKSLAKGLDTIDLALEGSGPIRCQVVIDPVDAGTLSDGEYDLNLAVSDASGKVLVSDSSPLRVE